MRSRAGNNPKRRVADLATLDEVFLQSLSERARYVGSGHHKRHPADYGFGRTSPVPTKSLCDAVGPVLLSQAQTWLQQGIMRGMVSAPAADGFPKYIWCVADDGRVFEAKTHPNTPGQYHGYPLENEDEMRTYIRTLWDKRCQQAGK